MLNVSKKTNKMTISEVQGLGNANIRVITKNGQYLIDYNNIDNLSEIDNFRTDKYFLVILKRAGKITGIVEIESGDYYSSGKILDYIGNIKSLKKHWYFEYLSNQNKIEKTKGNLKDFNDYFSNKYK